MASQDQPSTECVDPRELSFNGSPHVPNPAFADSRINPSPIDQMSGVTGDVLAPFEALDFDWDVQPTDNANAGPSLDQFFLDRGASFAAVPCTYCRRHRLQCLIMQRGPGNPNPEASCSTCVGLFRGCSLARGQKRQPAMFETPDPVIGQLHGVNEETYLDAGSHSGSAAAELQGPTGPLQLVPYDRDKRPSSRRYQKTRLLRGWYDTHREHPYPSIEDIEFLSIQTGLTKTQVTNWFTNARRRYRQVTQPLGMRHFRTGSPMPAMVSNVSPLERWRNSPPEDDHVAPQAVAAAIHSSPSDSPWSDLTTPPWSPIAPELWPGSEGDSLGDSASTSLSSLSSCLSHTSASHLQPHSRPRRIKTRGTRVRYECTFCCQPFKKKHDWARHERAVHMPELETYTCTIPPQTTENVQTWRINRPGPECSLCGKLSPEIAHWATHDFDSCAERPQAQRTFSRKDHFWQHLRKYHGCRRWEGWDIDLERWRNRQDAFQSYCGFCSAEMDSWSARLEHLAEHFKAGLSMENWLNQSVLVAAM